MGPRKTQRFLRYYEIPGYGHAASTVFNAAWDSLSALEDWVEQGRARAAGRCRQRRRARPHPPAVRIPRRARAQASI